MKLLQEFTSAILDLTANHKIKFPQKNYRLYGNGIDVSNYFYVPYTIHLFCPKVCFTTCTLIVWRFSDYFWHNSCKCYSKHTDCELAWCILCQGDFDSTDSRVVTLFRQNGIVYGLGINCNTSHKIIFM